MANQVHMRRVSVANQVHMKWVSVANHVHMAIVGKSGLQLCVTLGCVGLCHTGLCRPVSRL